MLNADHLWRPPGGCGLELAQSGPERREARMSIMFDQPERRFPSPFLWWVVAFATPVALIELWMGDYTDAASQAALALLLAIQAVTQGRPVGWFRATQWSLVILMALLLVVRVMRWTGFVSM